VPPGIDIDHRPDGHEEYAKKCEGDHQTADGHQVLNSTDAKG
jgi:hypothetical protein